MKITISKILNKTDLAESGSHGGLVVTKNAKGFLLDFFETAGVACHFYDQGNHDYPIRYINYTSNKTTPNDRISPIGRYAAKYNLKPGDNLIFQKTDHSGKKEYSIGHIRKLDSVYFVGKSKETAEALDGNQFMGIVTKNIAEGNIVELTANAAYEMQVRYMGVLGKCTIIHNADNFEIHFNGEHIEENKKYFELDTSVFPFELKKTDTWQIGINMGDESSELNDMEDQELVRDMANWKFNAVAEPYIPTPESKKNGRTVSEGTIPNRDKETADKALERAKYLCEYDASHMLFLRKKQPINYTEPHHLIPLKYDALFEYSLDVQANIVSLCSHCHNLIHYGADAEVPIRKLWRDRCREISDAGIGIMKNGTKITIDILLGFYGIK